MRDISEFLKNLYGGKECSLLAQQDETKNWLLVWKVEDLIEYSRSIETKWVTLDKLNPKLISWFGEDCENTSLAELVDHLRRVDSANTNYPILMRENFTILDGSHRYIKALMQGADTIPAKILTTMPAPDKRIPISASNRTSLLH